MDKTTRNLFNFITVSKCLQNSSIYTSIFTRLAILIKLTYVFWGLETQEGFERTPAPSASSDTFHTFMRTWIPRILQFVMLV